MSDRHHQTDTVGQTPADTPVDRHSRIDTVGQTVRQTPKDRHYWTTTVGQIPSDRHLRMTDDRHLTDALRSISNVSVIHLSIVYKQQYLTRAMLLRSESD